LQFIEIDARPIDVTRRQPRISSVCKFAHFDKQNNALSVMLVQYAVFIISRSGQPEAIAEIPKSVTPVHLKKKIISVR
jgi:hypothetical protein